MMNRRQFAFTGLAGALSMAQAQQQLPCPIGHRQANMTKKAGPEVFDIAKRIPGVTGVELQVQFQKTTLWDRETALSYKRGAEKAGMLIPSLAGVWAEGASLVQPGPAEETIRKSIQAAELLKSKIILVAAFNKNCPQMDSEASYGPVVTMLQKIAGAASNAGVTIGLETSLSPADDAKLVDLVARPSVKVYYDADNVERFGHKDASVPGYAVLGLKRIGQIHVKNEGNLLEEPGRVNWSAAIAEIKKLGYKGWLVFESSHRDAEQCVEATTKNIAFMRAQWARG
jgi:sugar phosphate isomerase/epimerase